MLKEGRKEEGKVIDPEFGDFTWLTYAQTQEKIEHIGSALITRNLIPPTGPERVGCSPLCTIHETTS